MATILKFHSSRHDGKRERASEQRDLVSPPGQVVIFPRMGLKDLCRIAEARKAGRDRLDIPTATVSGVSD
jgi:hypothetical protein